MQKPFTPKLRLIKTQIEKAKTKKIRVSRRVGTQESPENVILTILVSQYRQFGDPYMLLT